MDDPKYNHLLPQLSKFLSQQTGLFFQKERWPDLVRGMEAATSELGFDDTAVCMQWLLTAAPLTQNQIEILAQHLTIGETYFFREQAVFDVLQMHILPKLIESRRQSGKHLRIWSAGCSTGEEAYSLAILVQQMIPDFQQWNISILGTDINPLVLEKASSGIYNNWSLRNAPSWLREKYFHTIRDGQYEIAPQIRKMVTFRYLNLAEDTYPSLSNYTSAMDIIFCRNTLMYFESELAEKIVSKHYQALIEEGWLIVSPSEISQPSFAKFTATYFPDAILHQKISGKSASETKVEPPSLIDILPESISLPAHPLAKKHKALPSEASVPKTSSPTPMVSGRNADEKADYQQAFSSYTNGNYEKATQEITKLLAIQPKNIEAITLMVRMQANQGNLSLASQWYEKLIATDKLHAVGHYLMATVLLELRQIDKAIRLLKRTIYLNQDFVLAHFSLGNLCRQQGLDKEARKHFNNALLLLGQYSKHEIIPESDDVAAGQLIEIIQGFMSGQEQVA